MVFSSSRHPGHQFTGLGMMLDLRLNADKTPKAWSKPIDRVNDNAYGHDLHGISIRIPHIGKSLNKAMTKNINISNLSV